MSISFRFLCLFIIYFTGGFFQSASPSSYVLPPIDGTIIGQIQTEKTTNKDTLSDIARRHDLGFEEITRANPKINAWLPGTNTVVVLPMRYILPDTPHEGVVINLPEMRLYYYQKPKKGEPPKVFTYPVSIGRLNWKTPLGLTSIVAKIANPTWTPSEAIKREYASKGKILPDVIPAGPNNPLGLYALRLGLGGYFICGDKEPISIGMRVTHGDLHLYPEDIDILFKDVPVGTSVRLINQSFKVGWLMGTLYLQVFPPLKEDEEIFAKEDILNKILAKAVEWRPKGSYRIESDTIKRTIVEHQGLLVPVGFEL